VTSVEPPQAKRMESQKISTTGKERVIIVVDDNQAVRESLKFALETEGFQVRVYSNPNDLLIDGNLETAAGYLVTNYHMPSLNGLEMMTRLRERGVSMPALLITGHLTENMRNRAAALEVSVLEKPFLGKRLIDLIRQALDGTRQQSS